MLLYRISKSKYARDLTGEGARRTGGRWNLKGDPVVYTSDSTALATLEALVHVPFNLQPDDMAIACIELEDKLRFDSLSLSGLPKNWHNYPAPLKIAEIGSGWLKKCGSVALQVPSSVIPLGEGRNYLLNPRHPDIARVKIISITPYAFNKRLWNI